MKSKFLTAGLIAAMMVPAMAQAQTGELRRDRQDIRQEQRDLHRAQHYGDSRDVRDARDDGQSRAEIALDRPEIGVLVPPMVWAEAWDHSSDSVLLVLASHAYDPDDYIRDYSEFLDLLKHKQP